MEYSEKLLEEITEYAKNLMSPREIAGILGLDEDVLTDDIHCKGHPARVAYLKGYMIIVREVKTNIIDAATAGSPYAIQKEVDYLSHIEDEIQN